MEKLKALYESYIQQGIISSQTTFEDFSSANLDIQKSLYNQGVDNKTISPETTFDVFSSAWGEKKKSSRYSFRCSRGSYGIHYRNGNNSWLLGFFRGNTRRD